MNVTHFVRLHARIGLSLLFLTGACNNDPVSTTSDPVRGERCSKSPHTRQDAHTPESMVVDWGQPIRVDSLTNTPCPEDAIEISADGQTLFFMSTTDVLESLPPGQILSPENGTYRAGRIGGRGEFDEAVFYDLGKGTDASLDGEPSFSPDGSKVYFHSNRAANTGYQQDPPVDDYLDIYVADITGGEPGPGQNLGTPVNSAYPDGEQAIHPDGVTLYFTSSRQGGLGGNDIWVSTYDGTAWSTPVNLDEPINTSYDELQPTFTSDGNTMYFSSDRDPGIGGAIYRSSRAGDSWDEPELVIKGIVGEASLTSDGQCLYFVHVLTDQDGLFDADIWYSERIP